MRMLGRGTRGTFYVEYREPVTGREVHESLRVSNKRTAQHMARVLGQTCGNVSLAAKWGERAPDGDGSVIQMTQ
jgi:hypothetical protein